MRVCDAACSGDCVGIVTHVVRRVFFYLRSGDGKQNKKKLPLTGRNQIRPIR